MKKEQKTYRTTPKKIAVAKERAEHITKLDIQANGFVKRFAETIKRAKGEETIYNIAAMSGISFTTIRRVLLGKGCSLQNALKLCVMFNVGIKPTEEAMIEPPKEVVEKDEQIKRLEDRINRLSDILGTHLTSHHSASKCEVEKPEKWVPIIRQMIEEERRKSKDKEPIKGELAIFWRNNKSKALCRVYDKKVGRLHFDTAGIEADNAILCESMEQYKAFIMDAADNFKLEV